MNKPTLTILCALFCGTVWAQSATDDPGVTVNGVTWATRNVASPGTFAEKPESAGMFYHFDRKEPYYNATDTDKPADWDNTQSASLEWRKENDPSPAGWRLPTPGEIESLLDGKNVEKSWDAERQGVVFTDKASGNSVFFPSRSYRHMNGVLWNTPTLSYYFSGTQKMVGTQTSPCVLSVNNDYFKGQVINVGGRIACFVRPVKAAQTSAAPKPEQTPPPHTAIPAKTEVPATSASVTVQGTDDKQVEKPKVEGTAIGPGDPLYPKNVVQWRPPADTPCNAPTPTNDIEKRFADIIRQNEPLPLNLIAPMFRVIEMSSFSTEITHANEIYPVRNGAMYPVYKAEQKWQLTFMKNPDPIIYVELAVADWAKPYFVSAEERHKPNTEDVSGSGWMDKIGMTYGEQYDESSLESTIPDYFHNVPKFNGVADCGTIDFHRIEMITETPTVSPGVFEYKVYWTSCFSRQTPFSGVRMGNQVPLAINETRFEMSDGGAVGDYHTYREGDRDEFLEEMKGYKGGDPYILFIRQQ